MYKPKMMLTKDGRKEAMNQAFLAYESLRFHMDDMEHWLKLYGKDYDSDTDFDFQGWMELAQERAEDIVYFLEEAINRKYT